MWSNTNWRKAQEFKHSFENLKTSLEETSLFAYDSSEGHNKLCLAGCEILLEYISPLPLCMCVGVGVGVAMFLYPFS